MTTEKSIEIKIGRNTYELLKGDYILFNGACYQLCANRVLQRKGFNTFYNLIIPKNSLKSIPFDKLIKKGEGKYIEWHLKSLS